jgi:hypothetical protein
MGDVVELHPAGLEENQEFLADCCRFFENILSEATMRRKYKLADSVWDRLGEDEKLIKAIEAEKIRRMRDGSTKREKAQQLVVQAPEVLHGILVDNKANAKHRIDSAKALDDFAAPRGSENTPDSARFVITINLGADHIERYSKSIEINANDTDPASSILRNMTTL